MYIKVESKGNKILSTFLNDDNKTIYDDVDNFKPEIFVPYELGSWNSLIDDLPLKKKEFKDVKSYSNFCYNHNDKGTPQSLLYNKIDPEYQYIRYTYKNREIKPMKIWLWDIETKDKDNKFPDPYLYDELPEITLLQVKELDTAKIIIWGWIDETEVYKKHKDCIYVKFDNEKKMIQHFIDTYVKRKVAVLTAFHGNSFDFPYFYKRCKNLKININKMSPFGAFKKESYNRNNEEKFDIYKPYGSYWIDYVDIYKNLTQGGRESWSLSFIATYEEIEAKLDFTVEGFKNIKDFQEGIYNPEYDDKKTNGMYELYLKGDLEGIKKIAYDMFVEYGIRDVVIMYNLEKKLKLFDVSMASAQDMGVNLDDTLRTTTPWEILIYNELYDRKIAIPSTSLAEKGSYAGGYVFADKGIHRNCISEDVTSQYPHNLMLGNMSPETFVNVDDIPKDLYEEIKELHEKMTLQDPPEDLYASFSDEKKERITNLLNKYELCMSLNGHCFTKEKQGIIPELTERFFNLRVVFKGKKKEASNAKKAIEEELERRGISYD